MLYLKAKNLLKKPVTPKSGMHHQRFEREALETCSHKNKCGSVDLPKKANDVG